LKNDEIAKANEESQNIIAQAKNRSSEMQKIFDTRKEKLVENLFGRIMEK
jgi:vacuolar-type H+-ATPase subunit H